MAPRSLSLSLRSTPDESARRLIGAGLDDHNVERTGIADQRALDILVVDDVQQAVLGGLVGRTSLGVFFVDYFYLPDSLRGHGHGARALAMAESEAVRRGCSTAVLFTMAIQAPRFYEKHGYEAFGRIDCDPPGNARIFMKKDLRRAQRTSRLAMIASSTPAQEAGPSRSE